MPVTGGDRSDAAREAGDVDRHVALVLRPVPELAGVIQPPALDRSRARQGAHIRPARGDRGNAARQSGHRDRAVALGDRAVPQVSVVVVAPTLDGPRVRNGAGVVFRGGDRVSPDDHHAAEGDENDDPGFGHARVLARVQRITCL